MISCLIRFSALVRGEDCLGVYSVSRSVDFLPVVLFATMMALFGTTCLAGEPAAPGYSDYPAMTEQLQTLVKENADRAKLRSLGKTNGERDVWLLTLSEGDANSKPAILVLGSVDAANLVGSELAVRMAREILSHGDEGSASQLLEGMTVHIIPRPSPDASERFFSKPYSRNATNLLPTDDDRDGATDEDGAEDLNGDGWITSMRIEDPKGKYIEHPDDPRVMVLADSKKKNERGRFRILSEGIDNDGDEKWNEDGPGGVDFNRNFTFAYPYFKPGAGPHQVSEVETRAVADFAFSQPNLFAVFSFSPQDNLNHVWKPDNRAETARIKTKLRKNDAPYTDYVASKYRTTLNQKDAPSSAGGEGAAVQWAYFHLGRWSFGSRGWWIPKVAESASKPAVPKPTESKTDDPKTDESKTRDDDSNESDGEVSETASIEDGGEKADPKETAEPTSNSEVPAKKKSSGDKRGSTDRNRLRWFDQQGIEGHVAWSKIDHPDFPNQRVEVGGFKPYLSDHAPAGELDELAKKNVAFLVELDKLRPSLSIDPPKVEKLGKGVYRVTAAVRNDGYLPTVSTMGETTRQPQSLQLEIVLPKGMRLITGDLRTRVGRLGGGGAQSERVWLISTGESKEATAKLKTWSPTVGSVETSFKLK